MDDNAIEKLYKRLLQDENAWDRLLDAIKLREYNRGVNSVVESLRENQKIAVHHVFSKYGERAIDEINRLVGDKFILNKRESRDVYSIECIYDRYVYMKPNNGSRGYKCHYVHIDSDLISTDQEAINCIIKPSVMPMSRDSEREDCIYYF